MKRNITTYLLAALTLAACTTDDFDGNDPRVDGSESVIGFNPGVEAISRAATGQAAADALGGTFYVYGIKNEKRLGAGHVEAANLVFDNYKVSYANGTANTSLGNSNDWEYVGLSLSDNEAANITDNSGTRTQTVKYWDANAADYTFYAFAAPSTAIENGDVKVKKVTDNTGLVYDNGYTLTLTAAADPTKIYFSDRQEIQQSAITSSAADNTYGGTVKFSFRNAMAKVRVGMYETVPGYSVTIDGFEVAESSSTPAFGDMTTEKDGQFAANLASYKPGTAGTMTVIYKANGANDENRPVVSFSDATADNVLYLGDNLKKNVKLNNSTTAIVYDKADKGYTEVYPMEGNVNNLKLKVNFTLSSTVGEIIEVKHATAEVPAQYLQWKPGCAYTYIFKISDQTNGVLGSLTGLHPITFEAVSIVDGTGENEVISTTTSSNFNIVTLGYNETTNKVTVGKDDYNVDDAIYAVVMNETSVAEAKASTTKLYMVNTTDAQTNPITEASVENYLTAYRKDQTIVDQPVTAIEVDNGVASYVNEVPKGDDTADKNTLSAMKWTAEKAVYAVEYVVPAGVTQDATEGARHYKVVRVAGFDGLLTSEFTLSPSTVGNTGGTITPTLKVMGKTIDNADVTYALDTAGKYGTAVPSTVTLNADNTITVNSTKAGTYTLIATYHRRTYTTTFTVSQ
jgi:hypothetical protein